MADRAADAGVLLVSATLALHRQRRDKLPSAGYYAYKAGRRDELSLNATASLELTDDRYADSDARDLSI